MKRRTGLIVGKFSPLHKGHEFLIERALAECETLYIFSYSEPEFAGCEAHKREIWLSTKFPSARIFVITSDFIKQRFNFSLSANDAPDFEHRRFVGFLWLNLIGEPLDAVYTSENYGDGFARELTRYFSFYSSLPPVSHVLVDLERARVPISGTRLRQDVHALKHFLSPEVYAFFVKRVCLLGGESSGKSVLTELLAREFQTNFVREYGRTLWEEQNGNLNFEDLLKIAQTHVWQEEIAAAQAREFLFVDTSPLTTLFYSRHLFGRADPEVIWLANRKYDFTFLCQPDFPFVQDGTRVGEDFRNLQHRWYLETLAEKQIGYTLLCGSLTARLEQVKNVLKVS